MAKYLSYYNKLLVKLVNLAQVIRKLFKVGRVIPSNAVIFYELKSKVTTYGRRELRLVILKSLLYWRNIYTACNGSIIYSNGLYIIEIDLADILLWINDSIWGLFDIVIPYNWNVLFYILLRLWLLKN